MIADADDDAEAAENAQFIAAEAIVESLVGSIEDSFTDAFGYDTPSVDKSAAVTAGSNGAHAGLQSPLAVALASHDMMDDGPHQPAATPSGSKAPAIPVAKRLQPSTSARRYWANEICRPEMMTSVPRDLRGPTGMGHDHVDGGEDDDGMELAGSSSSPSSSSMLLSDSGGWVAVPRPEGTHCLVVAGKGITIARDTNGSVIHRFMSALPGGSPHSNDGHGPALHHHGHHQPTILECVYVDLAGLLRDDDAVGDDDEEDESGLNSAEAGRGAPSSLAVAGASPLPTATNNSSSRSSPLHVPPPSASSCTGIFVVLDLLAWRGMSYYDTPFEFRRFWSEQKLAEVDVGRVHGAVTDADVDAAVSAAAAVRGGGGYASNPSSGRATPAFDSATAHQAASYIHLIGAVSADTGQTLDAGAGSSGGGMDVEDDDGGDGDMTPSATTTAATGGSNIPSFSSLSSLAALMRANNHTSRSNNHIYHVSAPTAPATTAATTASHVIRRVLASAARGPINEVPFILAPVFDCSTNNGSNGAGISIGSANSPDGILAAYKFDYGSLLRRAGIAFPVPLSPSASAATATGCKDGLLFYHKSSHYECGPNPLVMHWRDAACSRRASQRHASTTADAAGASGSNSSSCTCRAMSCPGLAVGHHHQHHHHYDQHIQQYQQHVYGMGAPGVVVPLPCSSAAAATTATITTPASLHHRQHHRPLRVTLELTKSLALTTADGVHLGAMDPSSSVVMPAVAASMGTAAGAAGGLSNGAAASALSSSSCAVGDLLVFDVDGIDDGDGVGFDCGTPLSNAHSNATISSGPGAVPLSSSSPRLVNARYTHKAPHHRMHADSWSAILWRHMGRHGRTPTIQDLVQSQRR